MLGLLAGRQPVVSLASSFVPHRCVAIKIKLHRRHRFVRQKPWEKQRQRFLRKQYRAECPADESPDSNRLAVRSPESYANRIQPLQDGEDSGLYPIAEAAWRKSPGLLVQAEMAQLRKKGLLSYPPEKPSKYDRSRIERLRIMATSYDKNDAETAILETRRTVKTIHRYCSVMLGLPDTSKQFVARKSNMENESLIVTYQLNIYRRYVSLNKFPSIYADLLFLNLRSIIPAGVTLTFSKEVVHTVGKKFMTKDMRESAQKMAKRAMKGKSMRVV